MVLREIHFQIFSRIQLLLERFRKALVNAETATEREPTPQPDPLGAAEKNISTSGQMGRSVPE
jgi:hypothetical protein